MRRFLFHFIDATQKKGSGSEDEGRRQKGED